ncbi:MAG: hypothetical protein ACK41T_02460 [Pseudobdellovibrio sp.]
MRIFFTLAMITLATQTGYTQDKVKGFTCENKSYRYANVEYVQGQKLSVSDSKIKDTTSLKPIIAEIFNAKIENVDIESVQITVHAGALSCTDKLISYVMSCQTTPDNFKTSATLTLKAHVNLENGLGSTTSVLNLKADLESLLFTSSLTKQGPISLVGSKPIVVSLDQIQATTQATLSINNQPVSLEWNTFFKLYKNDFSFCREITK